MKQFLLVVLSIISSVVTGFWFIVNSLRHIFLDKPFSWAAVTLFILSVILMYISIMVMVIKDANDKREEKDRRKANPKYRSAFHQRLDEAAKKRNL